MLILALFLFAFSFGCVSSPDTFIIQNNGISSGEDDLRVSMNTVRIQGTSNIPTWKTFLGSTQALAFHPNTMNQVFFAVQIPHDRVNDSNIKPHFHWVAPDALDGNVVWCIEYTWANINEVFPSTLTECVVDATHATAYKHLMSPSLDFNGVGKTYSSMLNIRLYRDATNVLDNYAGDAFLLEFDIHYLRDKFGQSFN